MRKFLLFLILATSFSSLVLAQQVKLTLKEERAIDLMKVTNFISNKSGPVYLDHHEYIYQRDKDGDLIITVASGRNTA